MFIIFREFLMVEQIFLSPKVKRSNKLVYIQDAEQLKTS